jgi:hypothetical protein
MPAAWGAPVVACPPLLWPPDAAAPQPAAASAAALITAASAAVLRVREIVICFSLLVVGMGAHGPLGSSRCEDRLVVAGRRF